MPTLTARGKTALAMTDKYDTINVQGLVLHGETGEAYIEGQIVRLTKTEFRLLHFLADHAGETFTRQQLISAVQGPDYPATDRSVDSQIVGLRKKIGNQGRWIEAVRGIGYRFTVGGN